MRYRYRTPALTGPWRSSPEQALRDAARAKQVLIEGSVADPRWVVPGRIEEDRGEARPD